MEEIKLRMDREGSWEVWDKTPRHFTIQTPRGYLYRVDRENGNFNKILNLFRESPRQFKKVLDGFDYYEWLGPADTLIDMGFVDAAAPLAGAAVPEESAAVPEESGIPDQV